MTNPNDPAFPVERIMLSHGPAVGLTKREWFAGMAMQGYRSNSLIHHVENPVLAKWAIEAADALIAELNKEAKP